MFYLKIRSNIYHNAWFLAGSSRNEAYLESWAECKKERKEKKGKEKKRKERKKERKKKPPQNTGTSRRL